MLWKLEKKSDWDSDASWSRSWNDEAKGLRWSSMSLCYSITWIVRKRNQKKTICRSAAPSSAHVLSSVLCCFLQTSEMLLLAVPGGWGFMIPNFMEQSMCSWHFMIVSKRVQLQARMGFELAVRTAATIRGYHEFSRLGDIKSLKYSLRNLVSLTPLQFKQISQNACKMQYESTIAGARNSINASANLLSSSNRPRWVSAAICRTSHCSSHPARACNQLPRSTIYRR